jgi:DNA-binding PadR family transcriptional regulator
MKGYEAMKQPNPQSMDNSRDNDLNHTLHLYTSKVDKYTIQKAFLTSTRHNEKAVYVTTDNPKSLIQEFNSANVDLEIIKPEKIKKIQNRKNQKLRIIIDAGSILDQKDAEITEREKHLNELVRKHPINCLCTYDVAKLNPKIIKNLTMFHNQLRLTTSDLTMLAGHFFDKSKLSEDSIGKLVKDNLETIILALLQKEPMCGTEIIGTIHLQFNVLLSPGTIYPLLHSLKQRELITFEKYGKAKTYTAAKNAESEIRRIIDEHIQARNLLNHYLQQELTIKRGG